MGMNIKNAVFIWIPKNAGTSIHRMLGSPPELRRPDLIEEHWQEQRLVTFGHIDYTELISRGIINQEYDNKTFKFAFCRNPYSRALSLYEYLKNRLHSYDTFLAFCRGLADGITPIGYYNWRYLSQCNPQVRWVEEVDLNFLGRVEDFDEWTGLLFDTLGGSFDLPQWNPIQINDSNYVDPQQMYCEESLQIVEYFYAEDFKYFNYNKDFNQWIISNTSSSVA